MRRVTSALLVLFVALVSCGVARADTGAARPKPITITLMTHDSFAVSKVVLRSFTKRTGITVKVVPSGDAGQALNKAILTKSHPLADAFFGVDNAFLTRALDAGIFEPYRAPALAQVASRFQLDATHRLTPIDYGDVCVNFDKRYFAGRKLEPPQTLDDLADAQYRGLLVVENPATSSPGLAFVLATVAKYGERGWRAYWKRLFDNGVKVAGGWEQAYNGDFSGSAGRGPRPLVVSYASSPPAEVYFADPRPAEAPTGVMTASCFRQVELAGILRGTKHRGAARSLIDFLLSKRFQEDVPLQMFVFPVREHTKLPDVFTRFADVPAKPLSLPPATIGKHRDRWIDEWTKTFRG